MRWIPLETQLRTDADFVGATAGERGVWLSLFLYCADRETGGTITGCGKWSSVQFERLLGVSLDDLHTTSRLWRWDGDDVIVEFYSATAEIRYQKMRENNRKAANVRWSNQSDSDEPPPTSDDRTEDENESRGDESRGEKGAYHHAMHDAMHDASSETPNNFTPPSDYLVEIPAIGGAYYLTNTRRQELDEAYRVDSLAVAKDMAKKKATKAKPLKGIAETDAELARWVAQEAKNGSKGSKPTGESAWAPYFDAEGNPVPWFKPWTMDDEMNHKEDPLWLRFEDVMLDWQLATPRPSFEEFKANTEAVVS